MRQKSVKANVPIWIWILVFLCIAAAVATIVYVNAQLTQLAQIEAAYETIG